jgi:hypothetical protein
MIHHHYLDRSITTYVASKHNNHRQASNDTPQNPPTSQPNETNKKPKKHKPTFTTTESNRTSERYGGAEDRDPRRTTIHLIYMMTATDLEFVRKKGVRRF